MEKLIYVVWRKHEVPIEDFKQQLLDDVAGKLMGFGACGLSVNLADELAVRGMRITQMEVPMSGTVSIWLDTHLRRERVEDVLSRVTARLAGYLALESVPIVNTTRVVPLGERLPGLYNVAFLEQPDFLTHDAWLQLWQGHHTQVAVETQSTFLYIQNVLVRPLTKDAPPWTAIVEEAFPAEAANDPMVFYDAESSQEKLEANQRRMMASCEKFIDFNHLESHPMSSYVLKPLA